MAFNDPSSIKVDTVATPLARVFTGTRTGSFVNEAGTLRVTIKPGNPGKSVRNELLVRHTRTATVDPTINGQVSASVMISIQKPSAGLTDTDMLTLVKNSFEFLTATSDANLKKLIAGEN